MEKNKLISVIIPTFNRGQFIKEAVESVLNQDVRDYGLEVLVIDDGSTDNTEEVLKGYEDRIRYIHQANSGAGVARNRGIREARGEWISFLDSDDRWLPFKLSLQMAILEKIPECRILYSNFLIFEDDHIILEKGVDYWAESHHLSKFKEWKEMFSSRFDSRDIGITHNGKSFHVHNGNIFGGLIFQPCIPCWTSIISRQCITDHIEFAEDFPTWEDVWFFCQLAEKYEIFFMDVVTAENRGHTGPRLTQADPAKRLMCHIRICDGIYTRSTSLYRPSDIQLQSLSAELYKNLFKEYLKKGMLNEAVGIKNKLDKMRGVDMDISYLLYRIGLLFPGNPIHNLVKLKRHFIKD